MDPQNERAVFQQIVEAACRPGLPQYFLVTPKLLTGLEYDCFLFVVFVDVDDFVVA